MAAIRAVSPYRRMPVVDKCTGPLMDAGRWVVEQRSRGTVGGGHQSRRVHVSELLDYSPDPAVTWTTGWRDLDRLTGGFAGGQMWVITGEPGSGKTTLLTQFVYVLATQHQLTVDFTAAGSESLADVKHRFLGLACRRRWLPAEGGVETLSAVLSARLDALRHADLHVHRGGAWSTDHASSSGEGMCLAIDEPEFNRPPVLAREGLADLRGFADRSGIVLVTAPRSHCIEPTRRRERLREEWSSVADVILDIVPIDDQGGVELIVARNRRGPAGIVHAVHQFHTARFAQVDAREGS